jgi:hypothetical protein
VLAAATGATLWLFVWPSSDQPRPAAAVVVLAGGDGERLEKALDLMRLEVAPTLVLYGGRKDGSARTARLCRRHADFAVLCPRAESDAHAEARSLGDLAAARGWRSLVVVTSTYGVAKARLLVDGCVAGRVDIVGSTPPAGAWAQAIPGEWKDYLNALLVDRGC